jgi:hypothetical protein
MQLIFVLVSTQFGTMSGNTVYNLLIQMFYSFFIFVYYRYINILTSGCICLTWLVEQLPFSDLVHGILTFLCAYSVLCST